MIEIKYAVPCPHKDCSGELKIKSTLPAGIYPCICHSCQIQLGWGYSLEKGPYPYVSLADNTIKKKQEEVNHGQRS